MISYRDKAGNPFSQTYLKTVNNQLSAIMNYAVPITGSLPIRAGPLAAWERAEELLALTPADIFPSKRIDINKNYAKVNGEE